VEASIDAGAALSQRPQWVRRRATVGGEQGGSEPSAGIGAAQCRIQGTSGGNPPPWKQAFAWVEARRRPLGINTSLCEVHHRGVAMREACAVHPPLVQRPHSIDAPPERGWAGGESGRGRLREWACGRTLRALLAARTIAYLTLLSDGEGPDAAGGCRAAQPRSTAAAVPCRPLLQLQVSGGSGPATGSSAQGARSYSQLATLETLAVAQAIAEALLQLVPSGGWGGRGPRDLLMQVGSS